MFCFAVGVSLLRFLMNSCVFFPVLLFSVVPVDHPIRFDSSGDEFMTFGCGLQMSTKISEI